MFFILGWWEIVKMIKIAFGFFLSSNPMSTSQIAITMNSAVLEMRGINWLLFLEQRKHLLLLLFLGKMFQAKVRS